MRLIKVMTLLSNFIIITGLLTIIAQANSSNNDDIEKSIIILFDSSGSMADDNKIDMAKIAAKNVLASISINENDEVALIVFYDCDKIIPVVPFTTDKSNIISMVDSFYPRSKTPLHIARDHAKDYMINNARGHIKDIILVTDGLETCQ